MNKHQSDEEVIRGVLDAALTKDEDLDMVTGGGDDVDKGCSHLEAPDEPTSKK